MTKTLTRTTLAAAFAALTFATSPAAAEPVAFELKIAYSDLDLTSAGDVKVMQQRIRAEVRKACALPSTGAGSGAVDTTCRQATTRAAMAKLEAKLDQKREFAAL